MSEPSVWQRLTPWLNPSAADRQNRQMERIQSLTRAISRDPASAALYLCRGESYLEADDRVSAAADFRQALALAEVQFKTETWGVVAQALRDRAFRGLQHAQQSRG